LVLPTNRLVAAAKFLVAATKILFVVPNFVAVTKPFFFRAVSHGDYQSTFRKWCFTLERCCFDGIIIYIVERRLERSIFRHAQMHNLNACLHWFGNIRLYTSTDKEFFHTFECLFNALLAIPVLTKTS